MDDEKIYGLRIDDFRIVGDTVILKGNNFLRESCPKCGKSKTFLVTGGYFSKKFLSEK